MFDTHRTLRHAALLVAAGAVMTSRLVAQQANDLEYTAKIKEYLQDPRISTQREVAAAAGWERSSPR